MTVYADVLFLVNLSMDILSLYIVGRICNKRLSPSKILTAAVIGAVFTTAETLLSLPNKVACAVLNVLVGMLLAVVMTRVAFGKPVTLLTLIRESVMLWGSGALIGGIMSVILSIGEPIVETSTSSYPVLFAIVSATTIYIIRIFFAKSSKLIVNVKITVGDDTYEITALCDSGSFATEPISGRPVIIVKSYSMPRVSDELYSAECKLKLRMIPVKGIGGGGLMRGFLPDRVAVDGREVAAVVAIDISPGTYAENVAIIPSSLCK